MGEAHAEQHPRGRTGDPPPAKCTTQRSMAHGPHRPRALRRDAAPGRVIFPGMMQRLRVPQPSHHRSRLVWIKGTFQKAMRNVYEAYASKKSQATQLQEHLKESFAMKNKYKEMVEAVESFSNKGGASETTVESDKVMVL